MAETPKPIDPETLSRVYRHDLLTTHVTSLQIHAKKARLEGFTRIIEYFQEFKPHENIDQTRASAARLALEIVLLNEERERTASILGMIQNVAASEEFELPVIDPKLVTPEVIRAVLRSQAVTHPELTGRFPAQVFPDIALNEIMSWHPDYAQKR